MKKLTDLLKGFIKKDKTRETGRVWQEISQSDELTQFLASQEGPSGWTYSKLDKDGIRFRYDHPWIRTIGSQDLHGSLEKIREYALRGKSCRSCFMNPDGFCSNCYFEYFDTMDEGYHEECSLNNTIGLLTKMGRNEKETEAVKFEIAQQYHEELHRRYPLSMPTYSESLMALKDILYKLWKSKS